MSNAPADQSPLVLRVVPKRAAGASSRDRVAWVHALSTTASYAVETCPDVYRALARIGRDHGQRLRAVLVCVDELTPAELEFFVLVPRVRRGLVMGVCGARRACVERSVLLGARELDGAGALDAWLRLPRPDAMDRVPHGVRSASASVDAVVTEEATAPATGAPSADQNERASEAPRSSSAEGTNVRLTPSVVLTEPDNGVEDDALLDDDHDTAVGPARVPWLSYDDGPARAGPQGTPPATDSSEPGDGGARPSPVPYEPLLTDEELRALIGDDLASLGPERATRDQTDANAEEA